MPRKRPPKELWLEMRVAVWLRDGQRCVSPLQPPLCTGKPHISLRHANTDHIRSGKLGTNELSNLRTLCPTCHALRSDKRHRGLISKALQQGIIPVNWREFVWDD